MKRELIGSLFLVAQICVFAPKTDDPGSIRYFPSTSRPFHQLKVDDPLFARPISYVARYFHLLT